MIARLLAFLGWPRCTCGRLADLFEGTCAPCFRARLTGIVE